MKIGYFSARLAGATLLGASCAGQCVNAATDNWVLAENNKTVVIIQTDSESRSQQDDNQRGHQDKHRDNHDDKRHEEAYFSRRNHQDNAYHENDNHPSESKQDYHHYRKHEGHYKHRPNHRSRHTR